MYRVCNTLRDGGSGLESLLGNTSALSEVKLAIPLNHVMLHGNNYDIVQLDFAFPFYRELNVIGR